MCCRVFLCAAILVGPLFAADPDPQPRVYIEQSQSWSVGGWSPFFGLLALGGGARPQTAEIVHTFAKRCPEMLPVLARGNADYIVLLEHDGGKSIFRKDNKYAVFAASGDLLQSGSTRLLGNAVGEACEAVKSRLANP